METIERCDHRSVGVLVFDPNGKMLLVERKKYPFGFAPPAGHNDGFSSPESVAEELYEETGLVTQKLEKVIKGKKYNPCRRPDGNFHNWVIYQAEVSGDLNPNVDETKQAGWYSQAKIMSLAKRTELLMNGDITQEDFNENPGLEPVWYDWFQALGILPDLEMKQRGVTPEYLYQLDVLIAGRFYGEEFTTVVKAAEAFKNRYIKAYPDLGDEVYTLGENNPFIYVMEAETSLKPYRAEMHYLRALQSLKNLPMSKSALYVAIHDNGYLGNSAGIETAYAMALGKRIVFSRSPTKLSTSLPEELAELIQENAHLYPIMATDDIENNFDAVLTRDVPVVYINPRQHEIIFRELLNLERRLKSAFPVAFSETV